jgi:hypothetical protein
MNKHLDIRGNGHYRKIVYGHEMPEHMRAEFDYLNDDEYDCNQFVKYLGQWYDLNEFVMTSVEGWDGMFTETAFSAVLCKHYDYDEDKINRAMWFS